MIYENKWTSDFPTVIVRKNVKIVKVLSLMHYVFDTDTLKGLETDRLV